MIFLVTGSNELLIKNFIRGRKLKYKPSAISEFEKSKPTDLIDSFQSINMFSDARLIIGYFSKASEIDFPEDAIVSLSKSNDIEFIAVIKPAVSKISNSYKLLKKYSTLQSFDNARDFSVYNIADALFINKDKRRALNLLSSMKNVDQEFYQLTFALYGGLRNVLSKNENNNTWNKLHPFVKKKLANAVVDTDKIKNLYKELFELDVKLKSSNNRLESIQDFMLNSYS